MKRHVFFFSALILFAGMWGTDRGPAWGQASVDRLRIEDFEPPPGAKPPAKEPKDKIGVEQAPKVKAESAQPASVKSTHPSPPKARKPKLPARVASERPSSRSLTIVVSEFRKRTCEECDQSEIERLAGFLKADLAEDGGAEVLEVQQCFKNPGRSSHLASDLDFQKLRQAGARYLITGVCDINGTVFSNLEMRLWDVSGARMMHEVSYEGSVKSSEKMMRDFTSEVFSRVRPGR
jgi:hypothetical protein